MRFARLAHNDPVLLTYPQFLRSSVAPVISRPTSTSPLPGLLELMERAAGRSGVEFGAGVSAG